MSPNKNPSLGKFLAAPILLQLPFAIILGVVVKAASDTGFLLWSRVDQVGLVIGVGLVVLFDLVIIRSKVSDYRRTTPESIEIGGDRIVGTFKHHWLGQPEGARLTILFTDISDIIDPGFRSGGGRGGSWYPAEVVARYAWSSEPQATAWQRMFGDPKPPEGFARSFYLTNDNLQAVRVALRGRSTQPLGSADTAGR